MTIIKNQPLPPTDRIAVIDALRGFTLLGIIIIHMTADYYAGQPPQKYSDQTTITVVDKIAAALGMILINGKFYAIFSFLFGLSFYIQLSKAKADLPFLLKFTWRLAILFIIGFIHHLHYRGDILSIYAVLGFVLLITYRLPDKYILILGLILVFDLPQIIIRILIITGVTSTEFLDQPQASLLAYYNTFKSGSYLELLKANLESFMVKMDYQVWSGRIYMTPGLFLLGLYAGRIKLFENLSTNLPLVKKYLRTAAWGLLITFVVAVSFFLAGQALFGGMSDSISLNAGLTFYDIFNTFLAVIYMAWFIVLFQKEKWRNRLMHFYEAGRMGLTTYLMQAVVGVLIYSTLGLGLIGELGQATSFAIAVVIFILQIVLAKFWMRHFYYGPVEWIWRCLTNFKWYPLLKTQPSEELMISEEVK